MINTAEQIQLKEGSLLIRTLGGGYVDDITEISKGLPEEAISEINGEQVVNLNNSGNVLFLETRNFLCFLPLAYDGENIISNGHSIAYEKGDNLSFVLYREDERSYCIFWMKQDGKQLTPSCKKVLVDDFKERDVFDSSGSNSANFVLRDNVEIERFFVSYNNSLRKFVLSYAYSISGKFKLYEHKFSLENFEESLESSVYSSAPSDFS